MSQDILIQTLLRGEVTFKTASDGTVYQETHPPTRTALQAARALQNLLQQSANSAQLIAQLQKDHYEMWQTVEAVQKSNQELQDEIKSLQSPKTSE